MQPSESEPLAYLLLHTAGNHEVLSSQELVTAYLDTCQVVIPLFTEDVLYHTRQALTRIQEYANATTANKLQYLRPTG